MNNASRKRLAVILPLGFALLAAAAVAEDEPEYGRYIYAWPFIESTDMRPRGGTTKGPDVTVATQPGAAWLALQAPELSKKERDRRAILALAGPYRASFDFLETLVFNDDFEPDRPYRSWGTETIYVVADEPNFISLQHIMVMVFAAEDGSLSEPMVIKHWRQDWRYQDRSLHVYAGDNHWQKKRLSRRQVRGKWSQAVFQVDDSPRYEALGEWTHTDSFSSWLSDETWRPLPRREFSVRDDYNVLIGTNRHTVLPNGWVQEEDNLKVRLGAEDLLIEATLAREAGVNRYERITDYDWSAGDEYWQRTGAFWLQVREAWARIYRDNDSFRLRKSVDGQALFMTMFEQAERLTEGEMDSEAMRAEIDASLDKFLDN